MTAALPEEEKEACEVMIASTLIQCWQRAGVEDMDCNPCRAGESYIDTLEASTQKTMMEMLETLREEKSA